MRSRSLLGVMVAFACACNAILGNEDERATLPVADDAGGDVAIANDGAVDAGSSALDAKGAPETRPPGDAGPVPAKGLDVRYPIGTGSFVVQCTGDGMTQDVWQSLDYGSDSDSRFAPFMYSQQSEVFVTCLGEGAKDATDHYPIVFQSSNFPTSIPDQTLVAKCVGPGTSDTYAIDVTAPVQSHPAAHFVKTEPYSACP